MGKTISIDNIINVIRQNIKDRDLTVAQKYLASNYYERFVAKIRDANSVVIVGAGVYGSRLLEMLTEEGLDKTVVGICDNSRERRELNALSCKVLSVEEAVSKYPDSMYVITPRFYENEIMYQLGDLGIKNDRIIIFTFDYTGLID